MKVRLVKKDNLMKAANRANLVKVAVQVNGRTGQYSSHRWKNPNAALDVLKQSMERAGIKTTDELEFKSKKTNKSINEEELIKQYKESGTTDTLQDYVKKNFVVSKANEKKANVPGRKETSGKESKRSDNKKEELCELDGTEAEVRNATEVRRQFIEEYNKALKNLDYITEEGREHNSIRSAIEQFGKEILKNSSSRFWIDNRDMYSEDQIVEKALKIDKMREVESDCVENKAELLKKDLPKLDSSSKEAEAARAEVLSVGVKEAARLINLARRRKFENFLSEDILDIADGVFSSFGNTDPQFWLEAKQFIEIRQEFRDSKTSAAQSYYESLKSRTKLLNDLGLDENQYSEASFKRNELIANAENAYEIYNSYRLSGRLPEDDKRAKLVRALSEDSFKDLKQIMGSRVSANYWLKAKEKGVDDVVALLKYDKAENAKGKGFLNKIKPRKDVEVKAGESFYVDPKQEYKRATSYDDLNKRLSKLKGTGAQTVARAVLDMVGIDSRLRISKEDFIKKTNGSIVDGYCRYERRPKDGRTNNVAEVAVVDHANDQQCVYSTSVHEAMHGILANMKYDSKELVATKISNRFNEGMVELIARSATKAAYGKEYNSVMPSYEQEVLTTVLRLRERSEFSGMSVYEVGKKLGEKAVSKDVDYFRELTDYLNSKNNVGLRGKELNKIGEDLKRVERAAKRQVDAENKRLRISLELKETKMGDLVEQMKAGLISLEVALRSPRFKDVALALLYRMLEEDDEDLAASMSAFN